MTFNDLLMEIQFLAGEFGMLGQAQKLVGLSRFTGSQYLCFKMREKDSSDPLFLLRDAGYKVLDIDIIVSGIYTDFVTDWSIRLHVI